MNIEKEIDMRRYLIALLGFSIMSAALPSSLLAENEIQKLIDDAISEKEKKVVLPSGTLRLKPGKTGDDYHLYVKNASDLEIQGDNTSLVFESSKSGGILFENCRRVSFSGVTLDWDPIPYPQGRILTIKPEERWIEIQADKGYLEDPELFTKEGGALIFDANTRLLKRGSWDIFEAKLSQEREGVLRITCKSSNQVASCGAAAGDLLVLRGRAGKMGIRLVDCAEMNVENVTLWSAPGMGLQEIGGDGGSRYKNFKVTRGPAPAGGAERLLSSAADAFHSSGVRKGPLVENCVLEYQGDDGIAIHGAYMLVAAAGNSDKIIVSPKYAMVCKPGDNLRIYDGKDYQLKKEVKIVTFSPVEKLKDLESVKDLWKQYKLGDPTSAKYYELAVSEPVKVEMGDLVSSPDCIGNGFTVRKNVIRNNRAQGIRIKSTGGIIEDNQIEGCSATGIALGPELNYWMEGDFVQNVIIRNNTIRDVNTGAKSVKHDKAILIGAITVYALTPDNVLSSCKGNSNLVIEGNTIDNCGGIGILLTCIRDSVVKNNTVGNTRIMKTMEGGKVFGIDPDASIYVDEAENIKLEGNKTAGKGVVLGKNVKNVEAP